MDDDERVDVRIRDCQDHIRRYRRFSRGEARARRADSALPDKPWAELSYVKAYFAREGQGHSPKRARS